MRYYENFTCFKAILSLTTILQNIGNYIWYFTQEENEAQKKVTSQS